MAQLSQTEETDRQELVGKSSLLVSYVWCLSDMMSAGRAPPFTPSWGAERPDGTLVPQTLSLPSIHVLYSSLLTQEMPHNVTARDQPVHQDT